MVIHSKTYRPPRRHYCRAVKPICWDASKVLVSGGSKCSCKRGTDCLPCVYRAWRTTRGVNMRLLHPGEDRCSTSCATPRMPWLLIFSPMGSTRWRLVAKQIHAGSRWPLHVSQTRRQIFPASSASTKRAIVVSPHASTHPDWAPTSRRGLTLPRGLSNCSSSFC
jgi:hypothetical protein